MTHLLISTSLSLSLMGRNVSRTSRGSRETLKNCTRVSAGAHKMQSCLIFSTWRCSSALRVHVVARGDRWTLQLRWDLFLSKRFMRRWPATLTPPQRVAVSQLVSLGDFTKLFMPFIMSPTWRQVQASSDPNIRYFSKKKMIIFFFLTLFQTNILHGFSFIYLFFNNSAITVTGGEPECGLAAVSESFMHIPPQCCITRWCGAS